MREFNTSGPCNPEKHYTVMRESLVAQGFSLVERGKFFTIFAPRQAGKTTYFQLLFRALPQNYLPLWISFESLKTANREEFYDALNYELHQELAARGIETDFVITNQITLTRFFEQLRAQVPALVLVIDEFEDVPDAVLSELMHALRKMYQRKERYAVHALILVGVSAVSEIVLSSASPFNVVDQLQIPYFTVDEVEHLIDQYVQDSGQPFDQQVIQAIYVNTQGQPGLVCALCEYLTLVAVPDRGQPVTMAAFYPTLNHFLTERFDKNILNVIHKARDKQDFVLRILFDDEPIPFTVNDPDIAYLYAHGVVKNGDGQALIPTPLYSKALIAAFRPLINGETEHYVSVQETFQGYVDEDGLDLHAILLQYRAYVRRRGFRAFDAAKLKEAAWHYSLDGFLNFFIERLGGQTLIEVPSSRGRIDILILHGEHKYVIETKVFTDQYRFRQGKRQLAEYCASKDIPVGYYVVFTAKHTDKHTGSDQLDFDEEIDGKRIRTYLIPTRFEQPSR